MRLPSVKKIIGFIHLWLGLASGLVIFIVALTGALFVFSEDIQGITEKEFREVMPSEQIHLPLSRLKAIGDSTLKNMYGEVPAGYWDWQMLTCYPSGTRSYLYSGHRYKDPDVYYDIFIHPYSGKILYTRESWTSTFWKTVVDLHTNLLLGDTGGYIVKFCTLFFLIMVITGIILWWPRNQAASRQRFRFRWKSSMRWKRKNYDLHNILGFYASWIVIFMICTGLFWSFGWFKSFTYLLLDGKQPVSRELTLPGAHKPPANTASLTDSMYYHALQNSQSAHSVNINYQKDLSTPVEIYVKETGNWYPGTYFYFDPRNGSVLSVRASSAMSKGETLNELSSDIHYGWIFGWPSKIAVFFACLIAASLPVTGFYIWLGRKRR